MSKISESTLWNSGLYPALRKMRGLHVGRIENAVSSGLPDVEGCYRGVQFWWELKTGTRPVHASSKTVGWKIRPAQKVWHPKRWKAGGLNFFLFQLESGHDKRLFLIPGFHSLKLAEGATEAQLEEMAILVGRPSPEALVEFTVSYERTD